MADSKSGPLSKMTIHSFDKNDFQKEDKDLMFITPINPETFTKTSHIELEMSRAHGRPGTDPKYKSTAPEELKIDFVLDGTKTMEGYVEQYKNMEVTKQIKAFTDCVYKYEGKIHRPRFLIIRWGSEVRFPCVLSHMDISYSEWESPAREDQCHLCPIRDARGDGGSGADELRRPDTPAHLAGRRPAGLPHLHDL
jgi:hypothetical protein